MPTLAQHVIDEIDITKLEEWLQVGNVRNNSFCLVYLVSKSLLDFFAFLHYELKIPAIKQDKKSSSNQYTLSDFHYLRIYL